MHSPALLSRTQAAGRLTCRVVLCSAVLALAGCGAAPASPPALPGSQPLLLERGPLDSTLPGCMNAALAALPFRRVYTDEAWRARTGSRWADQTFSVPAHTTWTQVVHHYAAALPGGRAATMPAPKVDPDLRANVTCRLALWTRGVWPVRRQFAVAMIDQPLQLGASAPFKVVFLIRPAQ